MTQQGGMGWEGYLSTLDFKRGSTDDLYWRAKESVQDPENSDSDNDDDNDNDDDDAWWIFALRNHFQMPIMPSIIHHLSKISVVGKCWIEEQTF